MTMTGAKLRSIRDKYGLSQGKLAQMLNCSHQRIATNEQRGSGFISEHLEMDILGFEDRMKNRTAEKGV